MLRQMMSACDNCCAGAGLAAFGVFLTAVGAGSATDGCAGCACGNAWPFVSLFSSEEGCFFFFAIFEYVEARGGREFEAIVVGARALDSESRFPEVET